MLQRAAKLQHRVTHQAQHAGARGQACTHLTVRVYTLCRSTDSQRLVQARERLGQGRQPHCHHPHITSIALLAVPELCRWVRSLSPDAGKIKERGALGELGLRRVASAPPRAPIAWS